MRRVLVGLLALLGVVALAAGIGLRTVWLPEDEVTSRVDLAGAGPVAVTAPGVPELRDGPVTITATAVDPDGPVLLARGREQDVTAWVEGSQHAVVTGLGSPTALQTEVVDGEPTSPDPASSPMWQQTAAGTSSVSMTWDPPQGRWQLLVAADGTAPAAQTLTMTWAREVITPWALPLVVAGGVLLLAALAVGLLGLRSRRRSRRRDAAVQPGRTTPTPAPERTP